MDTERRRRISLLVRQNKGRQLRSAYLNGLSKALLMEVQSDALVALPETDAAWDRVREELKAKNGVKVIEERKRTSIYRALSKLSNAITGEALVFPRNFDYCGAVRLPAKIAVLHARELLELDRDHVAIIDRQMVNGLYLDLYEEGSVELLDLYAWRTWSQFLD